MINLCPPAIIYIIFSITQIVIDTFNGMYNTAFVKIFVMIMITFLLQILCMNGLNVISWLIVFIPFVLMTVIVSIILYMFGLNAATGKLNNTVCVDGVTKDSSGNIIIYDPYYTPIANPAYYSYPNFIVPKPLVKQTPHKPIKPEPEYYGGKSSSPAYKN